MKLTLWLETRDTSNGAWFYHCNTIQVLPPRSRKLITSPVNESSFLNLHTTLSSAELTEDSIKTYSINLSFNHHFSEASSAQRSQDEQERSSPLTHQQAVSSLNCSTLPCWLYQGQHLPKSTYRKPGAPESLPWVPHPRYALLGREACLCVEVGSSTPGGGLLGIDIKLYVDAIRECRRAEGALSCPSVSSLVIEKKPLYWTTWMENCGLDWDHPVHFACWHPHQQCPRLGRTRDCVSRSFPGALRGCCEAITFNDQWPRTWVFLLAEH